MNFADYKRITIPEGNVEKITANGVTIWQRKFINLITQARVWEKQYYSTSRVSITAFSNGNLVGIPIPNGTFTLRWWGKLGKPFITNTSYGRDYFIFTDSLDSFSSSTVSVVWGASSNGTVSVIEESTYNGQPVYAVTLNNAYNRPYGMFLCSLKDASATYEFSTDPSETIITINEPIGFGLLDVSTRTYQATDSSSSFLANTDTREMDYSKYYAIDYQGRRGTYCDGKLISHSILPDTNGFVYQVSSTSGYGLEFPIAVDGGKTYSFTYSWVTNSADVWLVKYNSDTTFNEITKIMSATNSPIEWSERFTTESGYMYSIAFTRAVKDADISAINISLKEVE